MDPACGGKGGPFNLPNRPGMHKTPHRLRRRSRLAAAAGFALALAAAFTAPAAADLTVKGDTAAWQEVTAAFGKLSALPGYRMKMAMGGGTIVVEVTSGGTAMHMMMHTQGGDIESYIVGGQTRVKTSMPGAPPGWQCPNTPPVMPRSDPRAIQGTVDVARGPDTTIDGQPMRVYTYTVEGIGAGSHAAKETLYVGGANGLPRRITIATPGGDQTMDYYDYGAPIQFTLPACGSA